MAEPLSPSQACVQCGSCMQVCPVYLAGRREELSARGKLRLVRALEQGWLEPSRELAQALGRCLLCGRCGANCPSGVAANQGVQAGRARLARVQAQESSLPSLKRLALEGALPQPERMDALARAGGVVLPLAQTLAQALIPLTSGLRLRLPGLELAASLPRPAATPFLRSAPREVAGPPGSPRLGLFVGCVTNYLRPELAQKAVGLLSQIATVVMPAQGCCGLPALGAGLNGLAAELTANYVQAFAQARVDRVVTVCGSCAYALAKEGPELLGARTARELGAKVVEISQVLAEHPKLLARLGGTPFPAALHDPCHLKIGLGVHEEPRRMLALAGVELAPLAQADACCGGGGLFSLSEPELSQAVFAPRAQDFAASGATALATSCSGCYLQWQAGLGRQTRVVHPIELLGDAPAGQAWA